MKEVHKYGGTSVDHLDLIVDTIISRKDNNPYICVSAFSGVTDILLAIVEKAEDQKEITEAEWEHLKNVQKEKIQLGVSDSEDAEFLERKFLQFFSERIDDLKAACNSIIQHGFNTVDHDKILGFGECVSAFLIAELLSLRLRSHEEKGKFVDLSDLVVQNFESANSAFMGALKDALAQKLINEKEDDEILVITGSFGNVPGGILHAIDRGYTDFMGALTAAVLQSRQLIIFKEVDGVCSTDPRIIKEDCLLLEELSYIELLKMASGGMKAVNTEAVKPAMEAEIPIEVRNIFTANQKGTSIIAKRKLHHERRIQNIPIKRDVCIVRFGGFHDKVYDNLEMKLLQLLEKHHLRKFFSTSDAAGTSVVIPYEQKKIEKLVDDLQAFGTVHLNKDCAIVAIVGEEMRGKVGDVIKDATLAIAEAGSQIFMVAQGASQVGLDFVIPEEKVNEVVETLHNKFF